jgi:hypothetical protein
VCSAFAAGAGLVVSVVVMNLGKNVPKSLIETSLAVMLLALCLVFEVKGIHTEALAALAAYTAV